MAWIIGVANEEEIKRIRKAGYVIDEILTDDREKTIFGASRKEDYGEEQEDKMIMLFVDCDVPDLLDMGE